EVDVRVGDVAQAVALRQDLEVHAGAGGLVERVGQEVEALVDVQGEGRGHVGQASAKQVEHARRAVGLHLAERGGEGRAVEEDGVDVVPASPQAGGEPGHVLGRPAAVVQRGAAGLDAVVPTHEDEDAGLRMAGEDHV